MLRPHLVFNGLKADGPFTDALWYGLLSHGIGLIGTLVMYLGVAGFGALSFLFSRESGEKMGSLGLGEGVVILVIMVVALLILMPASGLFRLALGAGIDHVSLLLVGGGKLGFAATFRAYCYSMASPLGILPCLGCYVAEFYRLVLSAFAYRGVHRMSGVRAGVAVVVPWVFSCFGYTALVILAQMLGPGAGSGD
jgi:hypothetical protein